LEGLASQVGDFVVLLFGAVVVGHDQQHLGVALVLLERLLGERQGLGVVARPGVGVEELLGNLGKILALRIALLEGLAKQDLLLRSGVCKTMA